MVTKALILRFLLTLTVQYEDLGNPLKQPQLEIIADSIAQVSQTPKEAAALVTMGYWESGWNLRVHSGSCKKWECDHGRARGAWQLQRNRLPQEKWALMQGIDHTLDQAKVAWERINAATTYCDGSFESTVAVYMGMKCNWRSKATKERAATYRDALRFFTTDVALQAESAAR